MVIAIILGLPQEDLEHFKRWSIAWVAPHAMGAPVSRMEMKVAFTILLKRLKKSASLKEKNLKLGI
jgi:cytochrome P450